MSQNKIPLGCALSHVGRSTITGTEIIYLVFLLLLVFLVISLHILDPTLHYVANKFGQTQNQKNWTKHWVHSTPHQYKVADSEVRTYKVDSFLLPNSYAAHPVLCVTLMPPSNNHHKNPYGNI